MKGKTKSHILNCVFFGTTNVDCPEQVRFSASSILEGVETP